MKYVGYKKLTNIMDFGRWFYSEWKNSWAMVRKYYIILGFEFKGSSPN